MKITSKNGSNFLPEGKHITTISKIVPAQPAESTDWKDKTPQLAITFRDKQGRSTTNWYNLKGYKKYDDLTDKEKQSGKFESRGDAGYAVNKKTGERVESPENTEKALNIIANLAYGCGVGADQDIEVEDLHGMTCGITVGDNERGQSRVKGSFLPTAAQLASVEE